MRSRINNIIRRKAIHHRLHNGYFFKAKDDTNSYGDEQEADVANNTVQNNAENKSFFKPLVSTIQRKCAACENEENQLQRKENGEDVIGSEKTEAYLNSLSGGKPLNKEEKNFFEPRLGYDFSNVRIHNGEAAAKSAQSVNAVAYTSGNNIVFNEGAYTESISGKKLLAHELMHVVQQGASSNKNIVQRDAGGVQQSKYGDINVDLIQVYIETQKWQDAFDVLAPLGMERVMSILSKLRDIINTGNISSLTLLRRNKPAGVQARFDALMLRADNFVSLNPMHADELIGRNDKLELQTFTTTGNPIADVVVADEQIKGQPAVKRTLDKEFSIFLPRGMPANRNLVHIFFTPFFASSPDGAAAFVGEQGLRAQSDASQWILIAVPALAEKDQPNFVTISTAEIQSCLTAVGRSTNIDSIRLSAHSRGHRGLENTMGLKPGSSPLIDLKLVEKITVFDASYKDLGTAITSHKKDLTAMTDASKPGQFKPGALQLYDVTVANVSGLAGTKLSVREMRALSFVRMIKEGLSQGKIFQSDLNAALPKKILDALNKVLTVMPARGMFSSKNPSPAGQTSIQKFYTDNNSDLMIIDSPEIKSFIGVNTLDDGQGFSTEIDAHHWFVAELAHEAVE